MVRAVKDVVIKVLIVVSACARGRKSNVFSQRWLFVAVWYVRIRDMRVMIGLERFSCRCWYHGGERIFLMCLKYRVPLNILSSLRIWIAWFLAIVLNLE